MSDEQGRSHGYITSGGVPFTVTVDTVGSAYAPDDAVLRAVGEEWARLAREGEPWRSFTLNGPEGSFAVTITSGGAVSNAAAADAGAAFVEKAGGSTDTRDAPGAAELPF